jgi:fatty acid-binding protein DegV
MKRPAALVCLTWFVLAAVGAARGAEPGDRVDYTEQIKPILTLGEEIEPVERVRTSARAFQRLLDYARKLRDEGATVWALQHIQDAEGAQRLERECTEIFGSEPVFIGEVGPVIGAHAGPGMLGVGGIRGVEL